MNSRVPDEIQLHDDRYVVCKIRKLNEGDEIVALIQAGSVAEVCSDGTGLLQTYRRQGDRLIRVTE